MNNKSSTGRIPSMTSKKVWQEAGQRCSFCAESAVEALHIHHITAREHGQQQDRKPHLGVCQLPRKDYPRAYFGGRCFDEKEELQYAAPALAKPSAAPRSKRTKNTVNFSGENNGVVANNVTFKGGSKPKIGPPPGTVGADPLRKNFMAYLLDKYHECRVADKSFGRFDLYNPGEIRKNIIRQFARAGLYHVPVERFGAVCDYITGRIDRTPLAKTLRARGQRIYKSFQEFALEQGLSPET